MKINAWPLTLGMLYIIRILDMHFGAEPLLQIVAVSAGR
jgi:hypothetical protein